MPKIDLRPTRCAICGTEGNAVEVYPANLEMRSFTPEMFSARRQPDRIHYRIVKCGECGLVRSDPAAGPEMLAELYSRSTLEYHPEIPNLLYTYGRYLAKAERYCGRKGSLLEIGCGNGFFLREALGHGFAEVSGVEPSVAAAEQAGPEIRKRITVGMMREVLFDKNRFDVVCMFQTLDHMQAPAELLDECSRVLKPGGLVLILNHDADSFSARLLGEHSPIIDIEHTFLYSIRTLTRLIESRGFTLKEAGAAINSYSLDYLARLMPMPKALKSAVKRVLEITGLSRRAVSVPLGNMYLIAMKPPAGV